MEINPLKSPFAQAYRVSRPSLSATLPRFKAESGINGAPLRASPHLFRFGLEPATLRAQAVAIFCSRFLFARASLSRIPCKTFGCPNEQLAMRACQNYVDPPKS
jgi:hypothetical protein